MKELIEYRIRLLDRWVQAAREFTEACKARDVFAAVEDSEWNTHQIASHVHDVDKFVYGERIRKTLRENDPMHKNFDQDKWMAAHYNRDEPLEKILAEFLNDVTNLRETLRDLPNEAWSRESRHETFGGGLTLQLWVERSLAHIEEHLRALSPISH
jgi:hypothetical protein